MAQPQELTGDNTTKVIESSVGQLANGPRTGILKEIEQTLGIVPEFMRMMPPTHLEHEWRIFRDFELGEKTALDLKTKELIGLAAAAVLGCDYCTHFHTVAAGMHGATPQEINETILMVKHTAGWSRYLQGANYDLNQLKREMSTIKQHMQQQNQPPTRKM